MPRTVTGESRSGAPAAFGSRYPNRQMPGRAAGRASFSHAATAEDGGVTCPDACGTPGARAGRGGTAGG
ncbi:hypothetical protein [Streptomyces aurantiogriseus]|uniref:hypothetical protein n=1 Tax=Streptomyces aurantiogriseus TaxID=66870 RepID=UPI001E2D43EE|nr:hypothetical protein [Streptomyces aurantiogriseus]